MNAIRISDFVSDICELNRVTELRLGDGLRTVWSLVVLNLRWVFWVSLSCWVWDHYDLIGWIFWVSLSCWGWHNYDFVGWELGCSQFEMTFLGSRFHAWAGIIMTSLDGLCTVWELGCSQFEMGFQGFHFHAWAGTTIMTSLEHLVFTDGWISSLLVHRILKNSGMLSLFMQKLLWAVALK